jgi:tetratricopeptide (TPR) repeat protein
VKKANLDAAVNLEIANGTAKVGFYTTAAHPAATILVKAGAKLLLQDTVAIDPGKSYTKQLPLPTGIDEHDVVVSISDGGRELVSYSPIRLDPAPALKSVIPPPNPRDVKTSDELYTIGLRAQQFHDPSIDPMPYWEEALRRDPGDIRVNTVLGITYCKKAMYEEAEKFLRKALERATDRYTAPKDGEAIYYLGVALQAQDKIDEAFAQFYKATWSEAWKAAGYYSLAEIAVRRGDMMAALDFVNRSIDCNALNIRAQNLKAAALRHMGRAKDALQVLTTAAHRADPLDVRSMAERWLASKDAADAKVLASTMNAHPATAQETAAEYLRTGLWQDGVDTLLQMAAAAPDKSKVHALVYYYLGYFANQLTQPQKASEYYRLALNASPDYVFPFQNEAIGVLREAMKANPKDARAPYYLGNLLYDWQPAEAVNLWETSSILDPSFAVVYRNLATAYAHRKSGADLDKAIAALEKAVSRDRKYPLHFAELDELYEQAGISIEKRLQLVDSNRAVVASRDDSENRAIALKIASGQYDEAIKMMTGRQFAIVEGANLNVAEHWIDAHILRSQVYLRARRYKEALADLEAAVKIPSNLPSGLGFDISGPRNSEIAYWTAQAYDAIGDSAKAAEAWKQAAKPIPAARRLFVSDPVETALGNAEQTYYRALSLQKLGQEDEAKTIFRSLLETGQSAISQPPSAVARPRPGQMFPRTRLAKAHFAAALGYFGLNDQERAKAEMKAARDTSPDLVIARANPGLLP